MASYCCTCIDQSSATKGGISAGVLLVFKKLKRTAVAQQTAVFFQRTKYSSGPSLYSAG